MPDWINSQNFLANLLTLSQRLPTAHIRTAATMLSAVWVLSMAADVFWRVYPQPQSTLTPSMLSLSQNLASPSNKTKEKTIIDVDRMQSWHLFGQASSELVQEVAEAKAEQVSDDDAADAKETRLQLKLLGLMQASSSDDSYAIIESSNKAELYRVGQAIPVGQNVKLSRVLRDRVLIDNRGSLEALLLYDENERKSQSERATVQKVAEPVQNTDARTVDQRENRRLTAMASDYRRQLMDNPMSLADVIRISMARDNAGNVIGYSIRPGRDRKQFADFGLQSGDIVTSVNGVMLDDPSQAMEIYNQLRTAQHASLSIKRGGEDLTIIVGLTD